VLYSVILLYVIVLYICC